VLDARISSNPIHRSTTWGIDAPTTTSPCPCNRIVARCPRARASAWACAALLMISA
jgi:hypothetical protein